MRLLASVSSACFFAVVLAAASQPRTISGTVVDPAGSPIPGVSVELRSGSRVVRQTVSGQVGAWEFKGVDAGPYTIRFALQGFVTTDVHATVGDAAPAPMRIVLKVGVLSETVEVQSRDALAAPSQTTRSAGISGAAGGVVGGVVGGVPAPPLSAPRHEQHVKILPPRVIVGRPVDTASYARIDENRFLRVDEHPLSTFSIDVDTASYANVRRFLNSGTLPPADAVRIEELINYFKFDYPEPRGGAPVSVTTEVGPAPWNRANRLALVGVRSTPLRQGKTPPRNLTFLLDVSGSMSPPARLPLVKTAMQMLVDSLRPEDTVAIVVYAGASGIALPATSGEKKETIKRAIEELRAGGSTNGAAGIQLAYDMAAENFVKRGINRVILATDGDFNVGVTSHDALLRLIEEQRGRGIFLSVLGVGDDNLKDSTMEMLADKGNGNYSYLDSIQEARRVLVAEGGSTFVTIAKDVKLQIEFNPRFVAAYRLIGYENRILAKEDFNNDRKDAGEMGAGHTVTALYELVPPGAAIPGGDVEPLKYQKPSARAAAVVPSDDLMTIKMRYKGPGGGTSRLLEFPVRDTAPRLSTNLGFAASVAEFGMLLRRSEFVASGSWAQVMTLAREHRGPDEDGYRGEFIRLADVARALQERRPTTEVPQEDR